MNKYKEFSRINETRSEMRKYRQCGYKVAYDTEEEARQKGQDHYECKHCKKWHRTGQRQTLIARGNKFIENERYINHIKHQRGKK